MKTEKRNLMMSTSMVLIAALSFSIGASTTRSKVNEKVPSTSGIVSQSENGTHLIGLKKYNGDWISVIQLPEVTITESALMHSK